LGIGQRNCPNADLQLYPPPRTEEPAGDPAGWMIEKARGTRKIRVIAPDTEKRYLTFRLRLGGNGYEESISVSISWDLLTGLMMSLQQYQASHKPAIRSNFRPRGKQSLSIVSYWLASPSASRVQRHYGALAAP
jgi:hypothetical protein